MKTKQINTGVCELLLAEFPDNVRFYKGNELKTKQGNWQLLCRADKITEVIAKDLVRNNGLGCYDNYRGIPDNVYTHLKALESWNSLLRANEIAFENELGDYPEYNVINYGVLPGGIDRFQKDKDKWNEAQQNVWDKQRTYIFKQL